MERFRNFAIGVFALFTIGSVAFATNYAVTQGSGTTFGSLVVSAVNYAQQLVCDPTTPTQCAAVDSSGILTVKGTVTAAQATAANLNATVVQGTAANLKSQVNVVSGGIASGAVASGAVASGAYASGSIASGALASGSIASGAMVDLGAQADSACSTDTGSCSEIALTKRTNQNLTTLNSSIQAPIAGVTQAKTGAAASSLVAKASAGSVVSISGSAASGAYIMLFNATSAPADGAVTPDKCWGPMAAAGPFVFGWGPGPVFTASNGITVVSSSTGCFTKTATNASFIAVEYQ